MKPLAHQHAYWKAPGKRNTPDLYLLPSAQPRSVFLLKLLRRFVPTDARILEVGCNAGRNLAALHRAGYENLTGLDINADALALLRETFPHLADVPLHVGPAGQVLPGFEDGAFDVVYTVAVLEHVHPTEAGDVFAHIVRLAPRIVTIEDEVTSSKRRCPRNYAEVFGALGMSEEHAESCAHIPGLGLSFVARVFVREDRA